MDDDGGDMDSLFSSFMNEVTTIKTTKMKKMEGTVGTPEEIVTRILASKYDPKQGFGSAYQILQVSPEASESDITKQYRKLSVLIHPDKCKLDRASDAFQVLNKAYTDTKDPNYNDKYGNVLQLAKERVRKAREKENAARQKKGEDKLDMDGNDFDKAVLEECERMTSETQQEAGKANSVLEANMKRYEQEAKESKLRRKAEEVEKKKWEKNKDKRAAGWQVFMENVSEKRFKSGTWQHIGEVGAGNRHFKQEERTEKDGKAEVDVEDAKIRGSYTSAAFTDRSYRKVWR